MPEGLEPIGKLLIILGIVTAAMGALLLFAGKLPWFGRLPGDILIERKNVTFYFPLVTCIVLSIVLTFIFWFLGKR
jgi:uncharacterized membrane protein required for colicin V production